MITVCFTRSLKRERRRSEIYKRRLMETNDKLISATEDLKQQLSVAIQRSDFFQEEFFKSQAKHKAVDSKKEEIRLLLDELAIKAKEYEIESLRLDAENTDLENELIEKNQVIANLKADCSEMAIALARYEQPKVTINIEQNESPEKQDVQKVD